MPSSVLTVLHHTHPHFYTHVKYVTYLEVLISLTYLLTTFAITYNL